MMIDLSRSSALTSFSRCKALYKKSGTFSKFNTGLPNQEFAGSDTGEGCFVQV